MIVIIKKILKGFIFFVVSLLVVLLFLSLFLDNSLSNKEKVLGCFMGNLMDSVSEKYDALSDEEKKLTSKEEILAQVDQEISGSGFFEAFDKNFDATKLGLFISLIVIIVLLGASFLAICLINKNMLQSFFEFSLVSFFGALIPLFFFKLFLKFQSYGFGYLPPEFDADSVVFASSVSDCVFSKSLALFSTVCFYSVIALLILAVLFYFLNRRSAT